MITTLGEFNTYAVAMEVAEDVWSIVSKWKYFEKDTVGKQLVRAVDSIASNLSEGLGRYHYREAKNFSFYARGSLFETKTWIEKSFNRKLISEDEFKSIMSRLDLVGKMINSYIKSIGDVEEPSLIYSRGNDRYQTSLFDSDNLMPNA